MSTTPDEAPDLADLSDEEYAALLTEVDVALDGADPEKVGH